MGLSVDSVPCLKAWAESLGGISYPLLSDFYPHGQVAQAYGVLRPEGYTERAIFVVDKKGTIRYVDIHDIDQQPDNEELFRVLSELEPKASPPQPSPAVVEKAVEEIPAADVVLYCTPWCPDCRRARAFLKERVIPYVEIDISRDRTAARQVREWNNGKEITPTFNVRGKILTEFNQFELCRVLEIQP